MLLIEAPHAPLQWVRQPRRLPQPDLHAVAANLLSGRLAAVLLQRLFDVVAIGRLKVAPCDECLASFDFWLMSSPL